MSDDSDQGQGHRNPAESELDLLLPMANVARTMKLAIPVNAKVSKEAKECMQQCVTEFVAFVTSEAAEICVGEKRKTINGQDILHALTSLGMENYAEVLKIYLAKYRQYLHEKGQQQQEAKASLEALHQQFFNE